MNVDQDIRQITEKLSALAEVQSIYLFGSQVMSDSTDDTITVEEAEQSYQAVLDVEIFLNLLLI